MTTTEKTVSVPVELLKNLDLSISRTAWETIVPDVPALGEVVKALTALIPAPPKVGDQVTRENRDDLPLRSVISDKDGDLWVRLDGGYAYLNLVGTDRIKEEPVGGGPADFYGPFTVVYIKESK
jgi:hypothetical protein